MFDISEQLKFTLSKEVYDDATTKLWSVLTGLVAGVGATLSLVSAQPVNFQMYVSAVDDFDLYLGNASSASTLLHSHTHLWHNYHYHFHSAALQVNDYIYIPAMDIYSEVWGLGGYTSTNGGATWTPILDGSPNWEVVYVDRAGYGGHESDPVMDLTTLNAVIANANTNSLWQAPVEGTAVPGNGQNYSYGPHPALGTIWTTLPGGGQASYMRVVFRYKVVPEPASILALSAGFAGLIGLRRRRAQ